MTPESLMREAIAVARRGIAAGQTPFGCCVALGGEIISSTHNTVHADTDITAHAEVNALRAACREAGSVLLEGGIAATTCEPCPMCMAALHWARVEVVYFGATIADAKAAGFNELQLPAQHLLAQGGSPTRLEGPLLQEECRALFAEWNAREDRRSY